MLSFHFQFKGINGSAFFDAAQRSYQIVMGQVRFPLDKIPTDGDLYRTIESARSNKGQNALSSFNERFSFP